MYIFINQDLGIHVQISTMPFGTIVREEAAASETVVISSDDYGMDQDTGGMMLDGGGTGATGIDSYLSSYPFVIGISSATLVISIILGILLAKRKIKKGYELYED